MFTYIFILLLTFYFTKKSHSQTCILQPGRGSNCTKALIKTQHVRNDMLTLPHKTEAEGKTHASITTFVDALKLIMNTAFYFSFMFKRGGGLFWCCMSFKWHHIWKDIAFVCIAGEQQFPVYRIHSASPKVSTMQISQEKCPHKPCITYHRFVCVKMITFFIISVLQTFN